MKKMGGLASTATLWFFILALFFCIFPFAPVAQAAQISVAFGDKNITVHVEVGGTVEVSLTGGSGVFTAASADNAIATAVASGTSVFIAGNAFGTTVVKVTDKTSAASMDLAVSVIAPLAVSPPTVALESGKFASVSVTGGTEPYTVSSSNTAVANGWFSAAGGSALVVTGSTAGSAVISITDSSNPKLTVAVTVTVLELSPTPSSVTVVTGGTSTVTISGGAAPYTVSSSDTSVATATASGTTVTVTGAAKGSATLTITDSSTPVKTGAVSVTVLDPLLIKPGNGELFSFTSTQGALQFQFYTVANAQAYLLNIDFFQILTLTHLPSEILLATGTPGFSIDPTAGTATLSLTFDETTWNTLSPYDISWSVSALSSAGDTSSIMVTSTSRKLKIEASNAVKLNTPTYNTSFDNAIDPPPEFVWSSYVGAVSYDLHIILVSGSTFGTYLCYPDINVSTTFQLSASVWGSMSAGTWYWTVIPKDAQGNQVTQNMNIFSFDLK